MAIKRLLRKDLKYSNKLKEISWKLSKEEAQVLYNDIRDNPEYVLSILWAALNSRGDI